MKAEQTIVIKEKRFCGCKCTKSSIPASAKAAESLAFEAVAEDHKRHYSRALELYHKCQETYAMKNDVKCDTLMNDLRYMNDLYKKRVERLILHLEKKGELWRKKEELRN